MALAVCRQRQLRRREQFHRQQATAVAVAVAVAMAAAAEVAVAVAVAVAIGSWLWVSMLALVLEPAMAVGVVAFSPCHHLCGSWYRYSLNHTGFNWPILQCRSGGPYYDSAAQMETPRAPWTLPKPHR